jgi:hypothetical protein
VSILIRLKLGVDITIRHNNSREKNRELKHQLRVLEHSYQDALLHIEQQDKDIQRLLSALLANNISIPGDIRNQYLHF